MKSGDVPVLIHHGVKGMRWGVRKKRTGSGKKKGISDTKVFKTFVFDKDKSYLTKKGRAAAKEKKKKTKAKRHAKLKPNASKTRKAIVKVQDWLTDNEEVILTAASVAYFAKEVHRMKKGGSISGWEAKPVSEWKPEFPGAAYR